MPAPTFELVTRGTAPNQYAQESDFESAVNAALSELWGDYSSGAVKRLVANTLHPSSAAVPVDAQSLFIHRNNNTGFALWARTAAPADGLETATTKKDATNQWWVQRWSSSDVDGLTSTAPYALAVATPSGQAIPSAARQIVTTFNGIQLWRPVNAPTDLTETDEYRRDASSRWWYREFDTRYAEYRSTRVYANRADALTLLATNPAPTPVHRVMTIEGLRINVRSRNEPNNDPLFASAPYWGIEYAMPLVGTAGHPVVVGSAASLNKVLADFGGLAGTQVDWQVSDTGVGTTGWSVIGGGASLTVPVSLIGKYLRFRSRSAATNMAWAISNVIGPIVEGSAEESDVPLDLGANVHGYGAQRRYFPTFHASIEKAAALRGGIGAGPPLDLYSDSGFAPGASWLGQMTAAPPAVACNLLTAYSPAENVIHPCVVEMFHEFCGWRYVCAITAYPTGPALEDPFLYGSNDRINWTYLGGAPQPLASKPAVTGSYNSDTFLTHDPRTGELIVGYRLYLPRDNTSSAPENSDVVLLCRASRNGYAWSEEREIMRISAEQQVMLAPTVIYDPATGTWHMWVINRPVMNHWTAPSLYGPWTLDSATTSLTGFDTPHHHEIKWVGDRLVCLMYSRGNGNLYFGEFAPGSWTDVAWNMTGILNPRPASLYKASFVPVIDHAARTLAFDIWWTAGAAGPAGGVDLGHGRKLQHSRTNAFALTG